MNKSIPQAELDALNSYLMRNRSKHDSYPLLQLVLHTGARLSEIVAIRPCDITASTTSAGDYNVMIAFAAKNSLRRDWDINSMASGFLCECLLSLSKARKLSDVTPLYRIFCQGTKRAGVRSLERHFENVCEAVFKDRHKYTPHCLRHAFAERAYRLERDVLDAKYALGHKRLDSTEHYLTFFDKEDLKKKMRGVI